MHRAAALSGCNRGGQCKCVEVINTRRIKFDYLKKLYAPDRAGVAQSTINCKNAARQISDMATQSCSVRVFVK